MMRALGAEVMLVPQAEGSKRGEVSGADLALVEEAAQGITMERGAFRADQFAREGNPLAHETGTAPEIWGQSGGTVTAFCDFVGSGGTLGGAARFFGEKGVRCYAVEPDRAEHPIQGGGYSMPDLKHLKGANLAGTVTVSGGEARDHARLLARHEGIFGGYSAGANLAAAVRLLKGAETGGCIAFVVCDSGLKYLSTDLWE
jgi:cysteine synthase A